LIFCDWHRTCKALVIKVHSGHVPDINGRKYSMTSIDSSAKSGMVSTSGNEGTSSSVSENAALFETLFGLMQTATDIPDAMEAQSAVKVDDVTELGTDLASLPAIIASVPLGSAEHENGSPRSMDYTDIFMQPLDGCLKDASMPALPQVAPKVTKIKISDGALAMAQTLLVAQSVGLVDAVADPNADTDIPATLDLKIGSSISAINKTQYDNELDIPVTVPAELFAKARALVKGEVAAPSRNNYDTGPQPVHQLISFLKQSVVSKDEKLPRVQPLATPFSDVEMPLITEKSDSNLVTYDVPHTVLTLSEMVAKDTPMPSIAGKVAPSVVTYSEPHTVLTFSEMVAKDTPMPSIAGKVAANVVTYNEPHSVLSAQQLAKLASATPMPNVMSRPIVEHVTYNAPHTVLTSQDMAAKGAPMPTIAGKTAGDAVLYSETHTVIEPKAEFKSFDISQTAKLNKAQIKNVIENGVIPPSPKDLAARAAIIVDKVAIRMNSEKPATHCLVSDAAAGAIQTSESNNGSGTQNSGNKGDGGGFDQSSRGNSQIMTAHRLNMGDKAWQEGFVRRIENSIKNGNGDIRIALEPRQLGRMQVKLGFNGDATRIQITTETAAAAALLSEGEGRLSQMLDQAGLRLGNLQTNASGSSGFDQNNNMGGQANSGQSGMSSGNEDQTSGKKRSQNVRDEVDNVEEIADTLENDNKTVLNILA
jgi:flagellar hook-length control protein FliK